jgi:CBS domain containing-hemolysin-like protein
MLALRTVSLRDDLQVALEERGSAETADFSESERTILTNVLNLAHVTVGDVMVERSDIQAIEADVNLGVLISKFRQVHHSRLPVYDDNLDNILGFIHVKDALGKITSQVTDPEKEVPIKLVSTVLRQKIIRLDLLRDAMFVPNLMPVGDLLQQMRASRVHMAIVVDEYGGTDGLVTIEDLLEAVVGEIEDEHDELAAALIRRTDTDTYIADARAELSDVRQLIGPDFDPGEYGEEVDTIGGLVFDLAGHVPKRGEKVDKLEGFQFEILAADSRRIKRLRIRRLVPDQPAEPLAITDQRSSEEKASTP